MSVGAGSLQQVSAGVIFADVPTVASSDKKISGYLGGARGALSIDINADTTGAGRLIFFAVDAQPQAATADFSFLAQARLDRNRGYSSSLDLLFGETGFVEISHRHARFLA